MNFHSTHDLEVLFFHYYNGDPTKGWPRGATTSYESSMSKLRAEDLLVTVASAPVDFGQPGRMTHTVTAKGHAFLAMLLNTPLPVQRVVFTDPRNGEVVPNP